MTDPHTSGHTIRHRATALQCAAYALRQQAIDRGDLEGWRLARRMRDAETLHQLSSVESELGHYLGSIASDRSRKS